MLKALRKYKNIFLGLIILLWLLVVGFYIANQKDALIITRTLTIVFLGLYYLSSVNKINKFFIFFLISLLPTAILFSIDDYNYLGMLAVGISRLLLILFLAFQKNKIDKKLLRTLLLIFSIILSFIAYASYDNSIFFYIAVLATILLSILASISFTKLLSKGIKRGNLEFFIAFFIFIISDALFGSKKLTSSDVIYTLLSSTFYLISYLLIVQGAIKMNEKFNDI